jgi:hypothetical protein
LKCVKNSRKLSSEDTRRGQCGPNPCAPRTELTDIFRELLDFFLSLCLKKLFRLLLLFVRWVLGTNAVHVVVAVGLCVSFGKLFTVFMTKKKVIDSKAHAQKSKKAKKDLNYKWMSLIVAIKI